MNYGKVKLIVHSSVVALILFAAAFPICAADWPQLQHDAAHTGRAEVTFNPNNVNTNKRAKWVWVDETHVTQNFLSQNNAKINYPSRRSVILAGDVQPIVASDRVYFGTSDGEFYGLNGADGSTAWKKQLGGPVLHTAAYDNGIVITGCMDGNLYAFDAASGANRWNYKTGAGISAAPIVVNSVAYVGSRDGYFYAINMADGSLKWRYKTVAASAGDAFSGAPIVQPAASDGSKIFFGAENMYFYALSAASGAELWRKKLGGQSFQYSFPVISNGMVMTYVMVPFGLSEFVMEAELDSLPAINAGESLFAYAARIWPQERTTIRNWLAANPVYRNFYAMDLNTGNTPATFTGEVPEGRVGGFGYPNKAPVIDGNGRILLYWRVRSGTFLTGGTFGSKYTPDISAMDPTTGDRVWLNVSSPFGTEVDNNYMMTTSGNFLYLNDHMRGAHCIDLTSGSTIRLTSIAANYDGANFRNWGNKLIWWGNDGDSTGTTDLPPPSYHRSPQGECGVVFATIGGTPTMFVQESGHYQIDFGALAAVQ